MRVRRSKQPAPRARNLPAPRNVSRAQSAGLPDIGREIHDMLEIEPSAVAELAEIKPTEPLPDLADIEATLERLRRERERLGAVNLRAEEELREVEAQHTSLTTERDDLVEAIKKLRLGIQSLNREARERLLTSFEQVNKHFQHLFTQAVRRRHRRDCN